MLEEARIDPQTVIPEAANKLSARLAEVRARMAAAAQRAGRDPAEITLIAVSKTQPAAAVAVLAQTGQRDFGENRIEEAAPKLQALANRVGLRWHMIGHIQSRKARDVIGAGFELVHSMDNLRLAERLSRYAQAAGRRQAVLLECNVSGEPSKSGFIANAPEAWPSLLAEFERVLALPGLEVRGLMTMAPQVSRAEEARPYFLRLRALRDSLRQQLPGPAWTELSMGMTDDFEVAIEAGSTLVRVGRAIFGERT